MADEASLARTLEQAADPHGPLYEESLQVLQQQRRDDELRFQQLRRDDELRFQRQMRESTLFGLRLNPSSVQSVFASGHLTVRVIPGSRHAAPAWTVDAAKVFEGLELADADVLAAVNAGIEHLPARLPKKRDKENRVVHPRLAAVFDLIRRVLLDAGLPCLNCFHKDDAKDPDWVFTLPGETLVFAMNTLFYVEAKEVERAGAGGDLMKDAVLHCIQRIVTRHWDTDRTTSSCIGVATNGIDVAFVRVNFNAAGFPCYLANRLFLVHQAGDDVRVCPKGLEYLVQLMCNVDRTKFGLPPLRLGVPAHLQERYRVGRTLGRGGFGNVFAVTSITAPALPVSRASTTTNSVGGGAGATPVGVIGERLRVGAYDAVPVTAGASGVSIANRPLAPPGATGSDDDSELEGPSRQVASSDRPSLPLALAA